MFREHLRETENTKLERGEQIIGIKSLFDERITKRIFKLKVEELFRVQVGTVLTYERRYS